MKNKYAKQYISKYLPILYCLMLNACSCNKLFFYPQSQLLLTPDLVGLDYATVEIADSEGIILHNWLLKPTTEIQGRILYLHGNAENISTHIRSVYWLAYEGYEVLLLDYRGYGKSQGTPCLPKTILGVEAGFQWLQTRASDDLPLFILGQSLGASLAAYSVGQHPEWPLSGLILDAPFSSYREIAREKLSNVWLTWPLQKPLSYFFSDTYSPIHNIENISPRPLLLFYSANDNIVPGHHSQELFDRALQPKSLITTTERHTGTFLKVKHQKQLLSFLKTNSITKVGHSTSSPLSANESDCEFAL